MDIRQLEYFIAAAESLSFSKAAAKCCVVQPTISHQIANLENELGVQLFERNRRSMKLTEAGELMLNESRGLVAKANDIIRKITSLKEGSRKSLRVGYYSTCIDPVFGAKVYEFAKENDVDVKFEHLDFYQGVFFEKLQEDEFDFVMTLGDAYSLFENDGTIAYVPLFNTEVKLVVCAGHPLAERTRVSKAELLSIRERFLIYAPSYDKNVRRRGVQWNHMAFGIPEDRIEVAKSTLEMQFEIEAGNAVGFMADTEISSLNAQNRVVSISVDGASRQEIGIAYRITSKSPLVDTFIEKLKAF